MEPAETLCCSLGYLVAERDVALKAIPRTLRMMYVHSYQTYLWNHAASTRVQKYGTEQVVLGDLVYCKENPSGNVREFIGPKCDEDCSGRHDSNNEDEVFADVHEGLNSHVKVVNVEDVDSRCYTIEDIVLPMPGLSPNQASASQLNFPVHVYEYLRDGQVYNWLMRGPTGLQVDCRIPHRRYARFGRGWSAFCTSHGLKEGDVFTFFFIGENDDVIDVLIHIKTQ